MKKISVFTGSRSEYWILSNLISYLNDSSKIDLSLIITGTHLSKEYGMTKREIQIVDKNKCFFVDLKLDNTKSEAIINSMSIGLKKYEKVLKKIKPDLLVILGDRYETFTSAISATILHIPIAHFHGGELTEGIYDDYWRHCITKLSHIHFVANKYYGKRVRQLGENGKYVKIVGGPGIDNIKKYKLFSKDQLVKMFNFKFSVKNILVVYHSDTLKPENNSKEFINVLKAIYSFKNTNIFISFPGHDLGSNDIIKLILYYSRKYKNRTFPFKSLGSKGFLSLINNVNIMIGNSSSAIIESPYLKTPVINVGNRQKGRIKDVFVFDCISSKDIIIKKINYILKHKKRILNYKSKNLYGKGNASKKAFEFIQKVNLKSISKKTFFNL